MLIIKIKFLLSIFLIVNKLINRFASNNENLNKIQN